MGVKPTESKTSPKIPMVNLIKTMNGSCPVEKQPAEHHQTIYQPDEQLLRPIEDLNLSIRSLNCLKKIKVFYIRELIQKTEKELLSVPHLGRKSLFEIKERLLELGFHFGMQIEQAQTTPPDRA